MVIDKKSSGHEQDQAHKHLNDFNTLARRNKLLGLWVAGELGVADAEAYAKEVIAADLEEPGDEDVIRKIMADIESHGADISEEKVRQKLEECWTEADAA